MSSSDKVKTLAVVLALGALALLDITVIQNLDKPSGCSPDKQSWLEFFLWGACHSDFDATYRRLLKLLSKPPFWLLWVQNMVKPLVILLLMGFPKFLDVSPEQRGLHLQKVTWKTSNVCTLAAFVALLLLGLASDVHNLYMVVTAGLSIRQSIGGVLLVLSLSSNVVTYMNFLGLVDLYAFGESETHDSTERGAESAAIEALRLAKGLFWIKYIEVLHFFYEKVSKYVGAFLSLFTALLFFPIGIPMGFFVKFIGEEIMPLFVLRIHRCRGEANAGEEPLLTDNSNSAAVNSEDQEFFTETHVPKKGWAKFFGTTLMGGVFIPFMLPVMGRLVAGDGYAGAVVGTFQDRHFGSYCTALFSSFEAGWQTLANIM